MHLFMKKKLMKSKLLLILLAANAVSGVSLATEKSENGFDPSDYKIRITSGDFKPEPVFGVNAYRINDKPDKAFLTSYYDAIVVNLATIYPDAASLISDPNLNEILANSSLSEIWEKHRLTNNKFKHRRMIKSAEAAIKQLKLKNIPMSRSDVYTISKIKSRYEFNFDEMQKSFIPFALGASKHASSDEPCSIDPRTYGKQKYLRDLALETHSYTVKEVNVYGHTCRLTMAFDDDATAEKAEEFIENKSIDEEIRTLGTVYFDKSHPMKPVFVPEKSGLFNRKGERAFEFSDLKVIEEGERSSRSILSNFDSFKNPEHNNLARFKKLIEMDASLEIEPYGADTGFIKPTSDGKTLALETYNGRVNDAVNPSTVALYFLTEQTRDYLLYQFDTLYQGSVANAPRFIQVNVTGNDKYLSVDFIDAFNFNSFQNEDTFLSNDPFKDHPDILGIANKLSKKAIEINWQGTAPKAAKVKQTQKPNKETQKPSKGSDINSKVSSAKEPVKAEGLIEANPKYAIAECDNDTDDLGGFFSGQHFISRQKTTAPANYVIPRLKKVLLDEKFTLGEKLTESAFSFYEVDDKGRHKTPSTVSFNNGVIQFEMKTKPGVATSKSAIQGYYCSIYKKL